MKYQILSETDRKALQTRLVVGKHANDIEMVQEILETPNINLKIRKNSEKEMVFILEIKNYKNCKKPLFQEEALNIFPERASQRQGILSLIDREINEVINETYDTNISTELVLNKNNEDVKKYKSKVIFDFPESEKYKNNTNS